MQCGALNWIIKWMKHTNIKTSEIKIKSGFLLITMYNIDVLVLTNVLW